MLNNKTDIIITSGAVSAGKYDYIPSVVKTFKLSEYFVISLKGSIIITFISFYVGNSLIPNISNVGFKSLNLSYLTFTCSSKNSIYIQS